MSKKIIRIFGCFIGIVITACALTFGLIIIANAGYNNGSFENMIEGAVLLIVGVSFGGVVIGRNLDKLPQNETKCQ